MTGYGAARRPVRGQNLTIEVRTVNHRFLETSVRGPRWALPFEGAIRKGVKNRLARGRVDVFINLESAANGAPPIETEAARQLVHSLRALGDELGIPGEVDLSVLSRFRDALRGSDASLTPEEIEAPLMAALGEALDALAAMRRREGETLERDILSHLERAGAIAAEIRERLPEAQRLLGERVRERIKKFVEGLPLEEGRLEQEIAYLAEKADISEELSRLESHIAQFRDLLGASESVGRNLDFLLQEMNREANTIASKSANLPLTQRAVELKSALEKIREQVQNVE